MTMYCYEEASFHASLKPYRASIKIKKMERRHTFPVFPWTRALEKGEQVAQAGVRPVQKAHPSHVSEKPEMVQRAGEEPGGSS